jgi:hypothetical protein
MDKQLDIQNKNKMQTKALLWNFSLLIFEKGANKTTSPWPHVGERGSDVGNDVGNVRNVGNVSDLYFLFRVLVLWRRQLRGRPWFSNQMLTTSFGWGQEQKTKGHVGCR